MSVVISSVYSRNSVVGIGEVCALQGNSGSGPVRSALCLQGGSAAPLCAQLCACRAARQLSRSLLMVVMDRLPGSENIFWKKNKMFFRAAPHNTLPLQLSLKRSHCWAWCYKPHVPALGKGAGRSIVQANQGKTFSQHSLGR